MVGEKKVSYSYSLELSQEELNTIVVAIGMTSDLDVFTNAKTYGSVVPVIANKDRNTDNQKLYDSLRILAGIKI
jgi:hypothetical protein